MTEVQRINFKQINKLAVPSIVAGIAEPLLSIVDTAIVGNVQINPIEALAAVGIDTLTDEVRFVEVIIAGSTVDHVFVIEGCATFPDLITAWG